jgi:hypothetical protein
MTKEDPKEDPFKLRREVLWLNKFITVQKREVCYKDWYKKGIIILHDILNDDGSFKTQVTLETEFHVQGGTMAYNSFVAAIPSSWK